MCLLLSRLGPGGSNFVPQRSAGHTEQEITFWNITLPILHGLNAAQSHPDPRFAKKRRDKITNRAASYANKSKHVANNPRARRGLHGVRQHMCGSTVVSERRKTRCAGRTLHLGRVQQLSASRANIFKTRRIQKQKMKFAKAGKRKATLYGQVQGNLVINRLI